MQKLIEEFLTKNSGYIKKSPYKVAERLNLNPNYDTIFLIKEVMKTIRKWGSNGIIQINPEVFNAKKILADHLKDAIDKEDYDSVMKYINATQIKQEELYTVLIIADIHEPFSLEGYLEFCKETYIKYNCNKVVFIGDVIDQAFSSFHPTNPDGYGAGDELDRAIDKISEWYKAFPNATVILGNHDRLAYRKAFAGGISSRWLRDYGDILNTPQWEFVESKVINNVLYIHGEAGTARSKAKDISQSVVQGHLHSQAYVEFINNKIFGMQIGTGVDDSAYAFNYNKAGKESILSCGVIIEGKQPLLIKF